MITTFQAVRRFDELNHKAILEVIADQNLAVLRDALNVVPQPFNTPEPDPYMTDVMGHIHAGNAVAAIKALRTARSLGLKEAKWIVDAIRNVPNSSPLNEIEQAEFQRFCLAGLVPVPHPAPAQALAGGVSVRSLGDLLRQATGQSEALSASDAIKRIVDLTEGGVPLYIVAYRDRDGDIEIWGTFVDRKEAEEARDQCYLSNDSGWITSSALR